MKKSFFAAFFGVFLVFSIHAGDGFRFDAKTGILNWRGKITAGVVHFDRSWRGNGQAALKQTKGILPGKFTGVFPAGGSRQPMHLEMSVAEEKNILTWEGRVTSDKPVETAVLVDQFSVSLKPEIPRIAVNGNVISIPDAPLSPVLYDSPAKRIDMIYKDRALTVTGHFTLFVQGSTKKQNLVVRLSPLKYNRPVTNWELSVKIEENTPSSITVKAPVTDFADGTTWVTLPSPCIVQKNSALDFSFFADAPAGKYGWIQAGKDGHLRFEKTGKRIRLNGINMVGYTNTATFEEQKAQVEAFSRIGYNSVRFHHFDNLLADEKSASSAEVSPAAMKRMFDLTELCRSKGMYVTIDLYSSRQLREGDGVPKLFRRGAAFKGYLCISQEARNNWKKYVRSLMKMKNPANGLSWCEDPVIFAVNLVNEDGVNLRCHAIPELKKLYRDQFEKSCKEGKYQNTPGDYLVFLNDLQRACNRELTSFLRDELGYKGLITSLNYPGNALLAGNRDEFEVVDIHDYWDHPVSMNFPIRFCGQSNLKAGMGLMQYLMPRRIYGKPLLVTEYNCFPANESSVEIGSVIGAYASLQDWDGIWRFVWAESRNSLKPSAPKVWEIANDPVAQMNDRLTALLFRRGDVKPGINRYAWTFRKNWIKTLKEEPAAAGHYSGDIVVDGLIGQSGTVIEDKTIPGVKAPVPVDLKKEVVSDTGELHLNAPVGTFSVISPCTEALIFAEKGNGKVLSVSSANVKQIVAVSALSGTLAKPEKILLMHLANFSATGRQYTDSSRREVMHWGRLPLLIRHAQTQVSLKLPRKMNIREVKANGSFGKSIPAEWKSGMLRFTLDNRNGILAYYLD